MPAGNRRSHPRGVLAGGRVLVTGAASGIGWAVVARCLAEGAEVAALDRNAPGLRQAIAGLGAADQARVLALEADIADMAAVQAAIAAAEQVSGTLSGVVTAAGIGGYTGDIGQTTQAQWDHTLSVNLSGTFRVCRAALPLLRANGGGRIVTVSSQYGLAGGAGSPAYASPARWR
jgi:NAD(P)-dependent dehydrogenase (short-subunit alcohol dehydrogenase family)